MDKELRMTGVRPGQVVDSDGHHVDSRTRLIQAAVESFSSKGFHATTTRDIASAAGMSQAALYVHYSSKEDVLFLICKTALAELAALLRQAQASAEDPVEQLTRTLRAYGIWHAEHCTLARVANFQLNALRPEHWKVIRNMRHEIELLVRKIVESGMQTKDFDVDDSHMTTFSLLSMGIDIARWFRIDGEWSAAKVADHYCAMGLRIVGAA